MASSAAFLDVVKFPTPFSCPELFQRRLHGHIHPSPLLPHLHRRARNACNAGRPKCGRCAGAGRESGMYHRAGSSEQSETHARRFGGQGFPRQGGGISRKSVNVAVKSALQNVDQETEAGSDSEEVKQIKKGLMNRAQALALVDKYLEQDDERNAVAIARALVGVKGGLRAFGTAQQVPQRQYTLQDLRLNKIEPAKFLSPTDSTLGTVRTWAQVALLSGIGSLYVFGHWDMMQLLGLVVALLFVGSVDQIVNGGGAEGLILDTAGNLLSSRYRERVSQHEAGHFLVSYLLGVLPRAYTLSSLNALTKYGALNVQAGTRFVDYDFQEEVKTGKLQSKTVDSFTCIALAGVSTEYLKFDLAEGGLNDINQLDSLLRSLGFSQKKADSQVRWAVLNTVTLLRRHAKAHNVLVDAMIAGKSVGECIAIIEDELRDVTDI